MAKTKYKWEDVKVLINGKEVDIVSIHYKNHKTKLGSSDNNTTDITITLKEFNTINKHYENTH